ncbi:MAG: cyclic nucleotide-binding domain-containing protein [Planctomycetes bacterium]|nr:cyclic nucleotide-binding domain-containing protein [Planctomycetota bacterium]
MSTPIVLRAVNAAQCPLFKPGEGMTVQMPAVVMSRCHAVCAANLEKFAKFYEERGRGADQQVYACSYVGCRANFKVEIGQQLPELQVAAPAAAPGGDPTRPMSGIFVAQVGPQTRTGILALAARLKTTPLFSSLPATELEAVAKNMQVREYAPGADCLRKGEFGRAFFLIQSGTAEVVNVEPDGTQRIIATIGPGQCFGEMSLLTGDVASATVRAASKISALVLPRGDFERMLDHNPQLNRHFNRLLAERLRITNRKLVEVQDGVTGRLAMMSLGELTQSLNASGRTGRLALSLGATSGTVVFDKGVIYDVTCGTLKREEAFYMLMKWKDGQFKFEPGVGTVTGMEPLDAMSLLMEGMRRQDEDTGRFKMVGGPPTPPPHTA